MLSDSDDEPFQAFAEIYVPKQGNNLEYYSTRWGYKLFNCDVLIKDERPEGSVMEIQLHDPYKHTLIANVYFDGEHGIKPVADSIRHFVVTIRNKNLYADLGLAFIDTSDAMEFSLITDSFARQLKSHHNSVFPQVSRKTHNRKHTGPVVKGKSIPIQDTTEHASLPDEPNLELSETEHDSDSEEFGEFQ